MSEQIPRIIHRTIPEHVSDQIHEWWAEMKTIHDGWDFMEHDEPLDPADWQYTGHLFDRCETGAQKADLVRLEALHRFGGIYVDSDVKPYRAFTPLMQLSGFAAWEDNKVIPNAVMGAVKGHPAIEEALIETIRLVESGADTHTSGVQVTTSVFNNRDDMLILPPDTFYPHHYLHKKKAGVGARIPWAFCEHMWHHSWGSAKMKDVIRKNQR